MSSDVRLIVQLDRDAVAPEYATEDAAGMDLRSTRAVTLQPGERALVPTGLRVVIPHGFEGQVRPRSGLALKKGIALVNSPGTIDADYRGEIGIIMINHGQEEVRLDKGERIAQLVICPVIQAQIEVVDSLDGHETDRGEGGFGSTGS